MLQRTGGGHFLKAPWGANRSRAIVRASAIQMLGSDRDAEAAEAAGPG